LRELFVLRGFEQIRWNFAGGANAAIGQAYASQYEQATDDL